ncbi:zinc finger protein 595-like isoform X3 [Takifugu flavidus]|uniref:zinc finger protein 595-like isoform X3 n=1 Tax=Takifugu flavidus TaxID=433684 RepID=UPI002544A734|nr:zinc finger protein 595-like isoform X3 [Takifugu flavidus]
MEELTIKGNHTGLPISVLRLLVPPVRLVAAAIWKTIEQRVVAQYGLIEEFISLVTDIVPEILTIDQRVQLTLGLRARLILELCQSTADLETVQPHLDRMQLLIKVGATNIETPHLEFVELVKKMLNNSDHRQQFFQVSSMFQVASSVLEECVQSQSQEQLKLLLHYQKGHSHLDHNEGSMEGAFITSALKLCCATGAVMDKAHPHSNIQDVSCRYHSDCENLPLTPTELLSPGLTSEDQASKINSDKAKWTNQDRKTVGLLGGSNLEFLQSQVQDGFEQCGVKVQTAAQLSSSHCQTVRPTRSQGLEKILLEEGRSLSSELLVTDELSCQKMKSSDRPQVKDTHVPPVIVEDDQAHPKNVGKSPQCAPTRSIRNSKRQISLCLKSRSGKHGKSNASESRACTNKKAYTQCLICKEDVKTSLKSHLKTHFPTSDYACPRCDSRFKLYSSLKLHLNRTCFEYGQQHVNPENADESKKLYKCDKCKECFRYKVALERHNLTHNVLYCGVCRKVLRDAATLVRHKASHTPFQCNRCEESFTLFKPLLRHCQNIHKITRPFKCIHCSKTSSNLRILIAHEWKHTGHLPFQCAHCGLRCKTDADLISHERVHTREKPYLCAECGKTFSRNSNLLRHLNFLHGESRNQKFSCSECEKFFKEKGALKKHQRSKHLKELFRHPCPYCGKMISASTMARHKLIHTGERPFKCNMPECDKVFRSNSEVKRHVLLHHSTERPYKCDVCGKGFIKICFLNAHAKIHSGEKPFICHICGKAFPKLYSMERHKKLIHPFIE